MPSGACLLVLFEPNNTNVERFFTRPSTTTKNNTHSALVRLLILSAVIRAYAALIPPIYLVSHLLLGHCHHRTENCPTLPPLFPTNSFHFFSCSMFSLFALPLLTSSSNWPSLQANQQNLSQNPLG